MIVLDTNVLSEPIKQQLISVSVLPYDAAGARQYARLQEVRRIVGRPLAVEDAVVAAICVARGTRLATCTTSDVDGLGLDLVDPWSNANGSAPVPAHPDAPGAR